jgi:hypothetical protein
MVEAEFKTVLHNWGIESGVDLMFRWKKDKENFKQVDENLPYCVSGNDEDT